MRIVVVLVAVGLLAAACGGGDNVAALEERIDTLLEERIEPGIADWLAGPQINATGLLKLFDDIHTELVFESGSEDPSTIEDPYERGLAQHGYVFGITCSNSTERGDCISAEIWAIEKAWEQVERENDLDPGSIRDYVDRQIGSIRTRLVAVSPVAEIVFAWEDELAAGGYYDVRLQAWNDIKNDPNNRTIIPEKDFATYDQYLNWLIGRVAEEEDAPSATFGRRGRDPRLQNELVGLVEATISSRRNRVLEENTRLGAILVYLGIRDVVGAAGSALRKATEARLPVVFDELQQVLQRDDTGQPALQEERPMASAGVS